MYIKDIRINGLKNPLGLDEAAPTVSWALVCEDNAVKNITQSTYEIELAETETSTAVWRSGVVESGDQSVKLNQIVLKPCTRYTIHISIHTNKGDCVSSFTEWETGFLDKKNWYGKWIGTDRPMRQNVNLFEVFAMHDPNAGSGKPTDSVRDLYPVVHFDKVIHLLCKNIKKARIYASAHGVYELLLNGQRIGNMELAPEFTAYQVYLQYQTYDVTEQLRASCNSKAVMLQVLLADGYYIGRIGMIGVGYEYGDHTDFLLQMEIYYEDGEVQRIVSDSSWQYGVTNILYSDVFIGEKQDMTAKWEIPDRQAVEFAGDTKVLVGQAAEPLRVLERLPAREILHTNAGETVIDFGQVLNGKVSLTLDGAEGDTVILNHTETLDREGNYYQNIPDFNCEMEDIFLLRNGRQTICPRFTVHGFRYVKVSGFHGQLCVEDCEALVIGSDCRKSGSFRTSDPRLNQLQHNIEWSQKSNFFSIPMDCPQRERAGWTGDIQIYAPTAAFNADVAPFLRRWLQQVRLEQKPNGVIPSVVPYSKGYQNLNGQFGSDTSAGWGDVCVILPWHLYRAYGDLSFLTENYEMMERWMAYVAAEADDIPESAKDLPPERQAQYRYLWNKGFHYGDWLYPSARNEKGESDAFYSAAQTREKASPLMYAYSAQTMAKVCDSLQLTERKAYYVELSQKIKDAFAAVYVEEDGRILPELQGIYVLALQMDMIPEQLKKKTVGHLVRMIRDNGGCLDTGFLSVPFLLDVLYENGEQELAYSLLFNEKCPSWLYEVKMGATAMWESWDAIGTDGTVHETSFNHYAFGCVGDFMYRRILGLRADVPGYQKFSIVPDLSCGLTEVSGCLETQYGTIEISWSLKGNEGEMTINVPVNTEARIDLGTGRDKVTIGSGHYQYRLKKRN